MAFKEHPRYATTEWPDYEFNEYPMMVYPGSKDGGKTPDRDPCRPGVFLQAAVIVQNDEELKRVLASVDGGEELKTVKTAEGAVRLANDDDTKAALIEEAEALGVTIDKRWGVAKLQDAIDAHRAGAGEVV